LEKGHAAPSRLVDRMALRLGPARGPRGGDYALDRKRIYILPSRAGLLFAGAMVTMLLATINYSLSLGYILTFVLVSVGLVSMLHTYRNLAGLILRPGRGDAVHAGQLAELNMTLVNRSAKVRYALQVDVPGSEEAVFHDVSAQAEKIVAVVLPTRRRGWMQAPRFTLSTSFPLGLWRAWTYWQPDSRVLVHPWAETPAAPLPESTQSDGEVRNQSRGDEDFSSLRPYRDGDSMRRMAWKAMARSASGEPLTKSFEGGSGGELLLDWRSLPATLDVETKVSRLTRWVLQAEAAGQRFTLALPGGELGPDTGAAHRAACLERLATFALPVGEDAGGAGAHDSGKGRATARAGIRSMEGTGTAAGPKEPGMRRWWRAAR
jgi:uncharacterized protein (DUF58 family)